MSTKRTTNTTQNQTSSQSAQRNMQRQYDPTSFGMYQQLNPQAVSVLQDYMTDPMKASYFNTQLAGANRQLGALADRQKQNLGLNQAALGAAPDPWRQAAIANQIGRLTSAGQADTFQNLLMEAQRLRNTATANALNYTPLETGQSESSTQSGTMNSNTRSVESTGGLGTWLAPVIGAGLGFAAGGLAGGAGFNLGGALKGAAGIPSGGGGGFAPNMVPAYNGPGTTSFGNFLSQLPSMQPQRSMFTPVSPRIKLTRSQNS